MSEIAGHVLCHEHRATTPDVSSASLSNGGSSHLSLQIPTVSSFTDDTSVHVDDNHHTPLHLRSHMDVFFRVPRAQRVPL